MVPGDPVANMYAALYGSQPTIQGMALLQDLKLGQYIKIPPRVPFLSLVTSHVNNLLTICAGQFPRPNPWLCCWCSP
jgi:OPT oligopeptide transporter protein